MGKQISERVAVVTGAASGIGRATAIELAEQGAKVVVTARRDEAFDELVERLGRHRAEAVPGDVTDAVLVMPASIDTPLFQQAAVHVGRAPKALSPTNPPERVARAIVRAAKRPRRELPVGRGARPMLMLHAVAPGVFERAMARTVERDHILDEPAPRSDGNLFGRDPEHVTVAGGWRRTGRFAR